MRLYWDLAMRLLWGSRLNAATRMTALLALGMLVSTAFGVIVVGMVNKGFSAVLGAETARLRAMPRYTVTLGVQVPMQDPGFAPAKLRLMQAQREFARAWGRSMPPEWNYRAVPMLFVPEHNLPTLIAQRRKVDQEYLDPPDKDAPLEEQIAFQARLAKAVKIQRAAFENLGLSYGTACAASRVGPEDMSEVWVVRTWSDVGQPIGSHWVGMLNDQRKTGRLPFHKKLHVTRLAPLSMRAANCTYWVSSALMDTIERRHPQLVDHIMQSNQEPPRQVVQRWFDNQSNHASGPKGKPYLAGYYRYPSPDSDVEATLRSSQKVENLQRLVSWIVVGMMGALAIYQVCSLMMMLGLHFRFDIAMLRSLGMSRLRVMMVFVVASIVIMTVGLGLGMLGAWWWLPHMNDHVQWLTRALDVDDILDVIPWIYDRKFVWSAFGIGLGVGVATALIPAWLAARARPSDIWKSET